ncbi:phage tail assembly protein [Vibrio fluvialis]|uniref:phage tail assembly protein n=1 Tax=Vibrio fluvialis TaxID=676 RepID=UPI001C9D2114|nr:phage tail assembly protein [Vibrio fluvialis]MBY8218929.1 phage tail assembly protein [Vibrio fluvialis]MCE7641094.1 phage tail assembly protein [Vibrio fluvialis]
MAILTFSLQHGYKVGESTHLEVGLKELNSGDYIDAQVAAEKVIVHEGKAVAYTSDVMYGLELLVRQVEYIGQVQGPLSVKELRKLHQDDFMMIQKKAQELDAMIAEELAQRGRP